MIPWRKTLGIERWRGGLWKQHRPPRLYATEDDASADVGLSEERERGSRPFRSLDGRGSQIQASIRILACNRVRRSHEGLF